MLNRLTLPLPLIAIALAAGCGREPWPDPPAVDAAQYQREYEEWRNGQQQAAEYAMRIAGIWPLPDGETPFGSDPSLPIVVQSPVAPPRAGVFRRSAGKVTVVPAAGAPLMADGSLLMAATDIQGPIELGSISFEVVSMSDTSPDRQFIMAWDAQHPDAVDLPRIDAYPLDPRWRVPARF
ncbi:MAG: hypothetical protein ACRDF9_02945, partial [Candidatus Limnocylindria bacterium]